MTMPADWEPDPVLSALGEERILWKGEATTGLIWKRVVKAMYLTNMRVSAGVTVMLKDIDSIVVANKRQITEHRGSSHNYSYSSTRGFEQYNLQSRGKTVGDVIFMRDGKPPITFYQIEDPDGVAGLAGAARNNILDILNSLENEGKGTQAVCLQCSFSNPSDSKFCNNCGKKLFPCPKCDRENLMGAAICGGCGLPLG